MIEVSDLSVSTSRHAAAVLGVSERTLSRWLAAGCPGKRGRYELAPMVAWARANVWEVRPEVNDPDPAMSGGESPALERYRTARAAQEEMKLAEMQGTLIPRDVVQFAFQTHAATWQNVGRNLELKFGPEAAAIVEAELARFLEAIKERFGTPIEGTTDDDK